MANFYWYGGTGNWSDFTNHWSLNSGNSPANPAANAPTSSDNVFIDPNSGFGGVGTITYTGVSYDALCHDFSSQTGHNYTLQYATNPSLAFTGSMILEAGLTFNGQIYFYGTTSETLTTNGCQPSVGFEIDGTGTITFQDDLTSPGYLYTENGTLDANDHNISVDYYSFYAGIGYTPTIIMGSGTWEGTSTDNIWYLDERNGQVVTITSETSTIKFSNTTASGKNFYGGGKTYYNFWTVGGVDSWTNIYGSNTFNDFKSGYPNIVQFSPNTTQIISSFTVSGINGSLVTLDTTSGLGKFSLSKSSGKVSCDYLDISNSNATGGAQWFAGLHSVNSGNNTGWGFPRALSTRTLATRTLSTRILSSARGLVVD